MRYVSLIPQATPAQRLMALNDELLALVRAGIPLDRGLHLAARDMPGQLARITEQLAGQLEQGRSLDEALRQQPETFPAAYRAMVVAGEKTGRLPYVLAQIAESLKRLELLRQSLRSSLAYPLIVLALVYTCFVAFTIWATPQIVASYWDLVHRDQVLLRGVTAVAETIVWWWPLPPLLVFGLWKAGSRRRGGFSDPRPGSSWKTPWRRLEQLGALAIFTEVLALLVEHQEPLPSALVLSGDVTGDADLIHASRELAKRFEAGTSRAERLLPGRGPGYRPFPPLLEWLLFSSRSPTGLGESLHRFSRNYQRQAERLAVTISFVYPVIVGTLVAGSAVLAYAAWVTLPWYMLLYRLGDIG